MSPTDGPGGPDSPAGTTGATGVTVTFGQRLVAAVERSGPLCAGIDPHASLLAAWDLPDDAGGVRRFAEACVEAWAGHVAVVKPQSAFFERHGAAGLAVLEDLQRAFRAAGTLVLLDVKRGDIGSTAQAYAEAYLDPAAPLAADAVTVSPFLGFGSLEPFLAVAAAHGNGVLVLARTSNPEGRQVQLARTAEGTTVTDALLAEVARRNADAEPLGSVGVVVGATGEDDLSATLDVNGPVLMPGIGAQGGTYEQARRIVGDARALVLPSVSRELLGAGPSPTALRAAAERGNERARAALGG